MSRVADATATEWSGIRPSTTGTSVVDAAGAGRKHATQEAEPRSDGEA